MSILRTAFTGVRSSASAQVSGLGDPARIASIWWELDAATYPTSTPSQLFTALGVLLVVAVPAAFCILTFLGLTYGVWVYGLSAIDAQLVFLALPVVSGLLTNRVIRSSVGAVHSGALWPG